MITMIKKMILVCVCLGTASASAMFTPKKKVLPECTTPDHKGGICAREAYGYAQELAEKRRLSRVLTLVRQPLKEIPGVKPPVSGKLPKGVFPADPEEAARLIDSISGNDYSTGSNWQQQLKNEFDKNVTGEIIERGTRVGARALKNAATALGGLWLGRRVHKNIR